MSMLDTEVDYNKVNTEFQREKWGLSRFFFRDKWAYLWRKMLKGIF